MPPLPACPTAAAVSADDVVAHTLLNCLLREVSTPEHQATIADRHLLIRLPRRGVLLRVAVRRASLLGAHRFTGPVVERTGATWTAIGWDRLAALVAAELELRTGVRNEEFAAQVAASHAIVEAALRQPAPDQPDRYLASEQSLLFGHRFHPTPKARGGELARSWRYAPEGGARFALRYLAVRADLAREDAVSPDALAPVDRLHPVPDDHRLLPVHPWQYEILRDHPALRRALADGSVVDLGTGGRSFAPTASVRTLYDGEVFLKCSLNVRVTNCVRKNASYELAGAVALTRLLGPVFDRLTARFPGCALLPEPAYRSLDLGEPALLEGFGVIVRDAPHRWLPPGLTPLLAAAVADEYPSSPAHISYLLDVPDRALAWWDAYLDLLLPPVLAAFFDHGVVLEPHLQNVLVAVTDDGMPARMLFRDLEGVKLLPDQHATALAALPPEVRTPLTYDAERGWNRVAYCLLVNHVAELLAALADLHPDLEPHLWRRVRHHLAEYGRVHGCPPPLRALLSGVPLPAKANLLTRWERRPDRAAGYVPLPSPLGEDILTEAVQVP